MFLYSLLALAVVTALIFAAPLKAKVWATLAVVAAGALWASATAVGVLAGGHTVRLWATDVFLFGSDAGSMDPLSALFALIVSVGAVSRTAWLLILVVGLLAWLRSRALRTRKVTDGATWGCGFTSPNVRMQYSGESYSEGLQSIATSLTQNSGEGGAVGKGEIFPAAHNFDIRHKDRFDKLFAAWWVELLRVINKRAMRLRTGKINHYVLFALAFLVLIFLLSIFNLI